MHRFASFDLQIFPVEEIKTQALSPSSLYGRNVFTTLAVFDGQPFLWSKHWRRLQETSVKISVDLTEFDEIRVKKAFFELIETNNVRNARARLTFFDVSPNGLWAGATQKPTHFLMTTVDFRHAKDVLRLTVAPFPVNSSSPLSGLKTGNYLENLMSFEKAREKGFDEAVRLNERDEIVSTALANLFWVKSGKIFTPSPETGCLEGTTRELLLENFEIAQVKADLSNLIEADEIFLTSSGLGIKPAVFENSSQNDFPTVTKLQDFYRREIRKLSIRNPESKIQNR